MCLAYFPDDPAGKQSVSDAEDTGDARPVPWEDPLEKDMATRPSLLAWKMPRTEEPGGLQSTRSQGSDLTERLTLDMISSRLVCCGVGQTSFPVSGPIVFHCGHTVGFPGGSVGKDPACQCRRPRFNPWVGKMPWRREWQPTLAVFPGESHGQRSLVGCSPRGHKSQA